MNFPDIYLASGSPRRAELLAQIGVNFSKLSTEVDESYLASETPTEYVERVAIAKAKAGWESSRDNNKPVLGADTAVIINDQVLGKPKDENEAQHMLSLLSGNTHQVLTAVALVSQHKTRCVLSVNEVRFATLSQQEMAWYIATQEGVDKAGGYAVQGLAAMFIEQIHGSYSGIMGLPLRQTTQLLQQFMESSQ